MWDPIPMNVAISKQKNRFCNLNFPVTLISGQKIGCTINKWHWFWAAKLAKSANFASSAFFRKSMKSMLVMTNYAKNYASTIYQSLITLMMSVNFVLIVNFFFLDPEPVCTGWEVMKSVSLASSLFELSGILASVSWPRYLGRAVRGTISWLQHWLSHIHPGPVFPDV